MAVGGLLCNAFEAVQYSQICGCNAYRSDLNWAKKKKKKNSNGEKWLFVLLLRECQTYFPRASRYVKGSRWRQGSSTGENRLALLSLLNKRATLETPLSVPLCLYTSFAPCPIHVPRHGNLQNVTIHDTRSLVTDLTENNLLIYNKS